MGITKWMRPNKETLRVTLFDAPLGLIVSIGCANHQLPIDFPSPLKPRNYIAPIKFYHFLMIQGFPLHPKCLCSLRTETRHRAEYAFLRYYACLVNAVTHAMSATERLKSAFRDLDHTPLQIFISTY